MQENIKVRIKKSKINNQHVQGTNRNPQQSNPSRIPASEITKFQNTLQFLKQRPLQNLVEKEFVSLLKREAHVDEKELNLILEGIKVDQKLRWVMKSYFSIAFNHQQGKQYEQKQFIEQQYQREKVTPQKELQVFQSQLEEEKLHDRLILLSSYQTTTVKIIIEALLFLKNVFQQRLIHKKLTNEFQRSDLMKKLQVLEYEGVKTSKTKSSVNHRDSQKRLSKKSIHFNPHISQFSKDSSHQNQFKKQESQKNNFSILQSKVFTIVVLEYEKLQTREKLFHSHLKLIEKAINSREAKTSLTFDKTEGVSQSLVVQQQNLTSYFALRYLNLRVQFQPKNSQSSILRQVKQRRNQCNQVIAQLQQSNNLNNLSLVVNSKKIFLKNLDKIIDGIKRRVQRQLLGEKQLIVEQDEQLWPTTKVAQNHKTRKYSNTNYQTIKNSKYQLTQDILNQQNKKYFMNRNRSKQKIQDEHIKNHNQMKIKKGDENENGNSKGHFQQFSEMGQETKPKRRTLSVKQIGRSRSLRLTRQNLHQNIFPKEETDTRQKYKTLQKRSRSVFNFTRKRGDNSSSMKTLLQSPLSRQIQIYLAYQKFMQKSQPQQKFMQKSNHQPQQTPLTITNSITTTKHSDKPPINGVDLLQQVMNSKKHPPTNKLLSSSKKKKISTIYKAFTYNNKIIDISHWKLQQEINDSSSNYFFNKKVVSNQFNQPICQFGAGIRNLNHALDQMLAEKYQQGIHYVKFWQEKVCFYSVRLSQEKDSFMLYMKMNDQAIKLILPRGNNILCERYRTIWPTIRYLFQKKIFQFPIIKFFQHIFYQKKNIKLNENVDKAKEDELNKLIPGKTIIPNKNPNQLYHHPLSDENQCSVYRQTFGNVGSDEIEQLNSCFDYIHKFLGLISSQIRTQNGTKDIIWPLQDNSSMKRIHQMSELGLQNFKKLFTSNSREIRQQYVWRRIAKFWVTMDKMEQVYLFSFITKANNHHIDSGRYFCTVKISKDQVSKVLETFIAHAVCKDDQSEKQKQLVRDKYYQVELKFKVYWRSCYQDRKMFNHKNSPSNQNQQFATVHLSFQRLSLYSMDLKFLEEGFTNIIVNNYYSPMFIHKLKQLFQQSLLIETSLEGEKIYDIYQPNLQKMKKNYLLHKDHSIFKDYYKNTYHPRKHKIPLYKPIKTGRYLFNNQNSLTKQQIQEPFENQNKDTNFNQFNYVESKNEIQVIENYLDILKWNSRQKYVSLKPNSKWKIVQKKIHTIIAFVSHLSKKTQRKSSLLSSQKMRDNHQFGQVSESKRVQRMSPLMMKSLQRVKKSELSFLQKIQNQLYIIKVNLRQCMNSANNEQSSFPNKWMAECILIKQNSKQYQKFYISSADVEAIFKSKRQANNQNHSISESYDLFNSHWSYDIKKTVGNRQGNPSYNRQERNPSTKIKRKQTQRSQQSLDNESQLKATSKELSSVYDNINSGDERDLFRTGGNAAYCKEGDKNGWEFSQFSHHDQTNRRATKQKRLRMFRSIIRSISFTKIKCFSKILISRRCHQTQRILHFIAQPRSSLQILHQTAQNPDKAFQLKYFVPLQNCYQTIICKPIKIRYQKKIDYVIITLFKIQLREKESFYQFRINLNKNQTYYACEINQLELRELIQFSENQMIQRNAELDEENNSFVELMGQLNNQKGQLQKKKKLQPNFLKALAKTSLQEGINQKLDKNPSILKESQFRASNFPNAQQCSAILPQSHELINSKTSYGSCNNILLAMVGKLEQFSKEVLQNIFKQIQLKIIPNEKNSTHDIILLKVPKANFQKVLKIRVLQRISKDKNCIYMVEVNEKNIRRLNSIVFQNSMNNNFDIFKQNIFKNGKTKSSDQTDGQMKNDWNDFQKEKKENGETLGISFVQYTQKLRNSHHQNEINLVFSSFCLSKRYNNSSTAVEIMSQQNIIEDIAYQVEKKYGKQILMKFNTKKIKSYAQIFLNYYLKYVHSGERENHNR